MNSVIPQKKKNRFIAAIWRQYKMNKLAYISLWVLAAFVSIAVLCPILANNKPLYVKYKGKSYFPAITFDNYYEIGSVGTAEYEKIQIDIADWKRVDCELVIWAPVTYSPGVSDKLNKYLNAGYKSPNEQQLFESAQGLVNPLPKRFWHWLGTNKKGEDVFSGLIHGTRVSLLVGIVSMAIATVVGLIIGALAGYFGDNKLRTTRGVFWFLLPGAGIGFYYGFIVRSFALYDGLSLSISSFLIQAFVSTLIFTAICVVFYFIGKRVSRIPGFDKKVNIPIDAAISRTMEIIISVPKLILIVTIAAIVSNPSIITVVLIISLTSWVPIARLTRAEFLKIRELDYIQAGTALGYSERRIIFKHAMPNSLAPALVASAFGVASAILIESGLSFLGIGVPDDVVTWGSLLRDAKENFEAWWLVIFPGLGIFIIVAISNLIGEGLRDATDPKYRK